MSSFEKTLLASASHLQTFLLVSALFSGICLWDFILCIGPEAKHLFIPEIKACFKKKKTPALATFCLFLNRLLTVPTVALLLTIISPSDKSNETKVIYFQAFLGCIVVACANACSIFALRTMAIRSSDLPMRITLWISVFFITALFIACVILQEFPSDTFALFPSTATTASYIKPIHMWLNWVIFHAVVLLYSLAVFILTITTHFQGFKWIPSRSRIGEKFYRQAVGFFLLTTTITLVELIWIYENRDSRIYVALVVPVQMWLCLSISSHVVSGLKLHTAREAYRTSMMLNNTTQSNTYRRAGGLNDGTASQTINSTSPLMAKQLLSKSSSTATTDKDKDGIHFTSVTITQTDSPESTSTALPELYK